MTTCETDNCGENAPLERVDDDDDDSSTLADGYQQTSTTSSYPRRLQRLRLP